MCGSEQTYKIWACTGSGDFVSPVCPSFTGAEGSKGGAVFTCVVPGPGFFFFREFGKNAVASFLKSRN